VAPACGRRNMEPEPAEWSRGTPGINQPRCSQPSQPRSTTRLRRR
jgi:hypothetical protein